MSRGVYHFARDIENRLPEDHPLKNEVAHSGRRREVSLHKSKPTRTSFLESLRKHWCPTGILLIALLLLEGTFLTCIGIGTIYLEKDQCPGDTNIAPTLLSFGSIALFLGIFIPPTIRWSTSSFRVLRVIVISFLGLALVAELCLLIYLAVIVFQLYPKVVHERSTNSGSDQYYCHPILFTFSFVVSIVTVIIAALFGISIPLTQ